MRVAIYSPYLDTFGGGERYMMTIAEVLAKAHEVDVLLNKHLYSLRKDYLKGELSKRFNLNLEKAYFILSPMGQNSNFFSRLLFLRKYDLLFYLTDGSIFISTAKKNVLHIQSPLVGQPARSLWGKFKLRGWNKIIYNSEFTKVNAEKNWPLSSFVIYPPVDISKLKPLKKQNYILSVGRFFGFLKNKKHEVMINAFIDLCNSGVVKGWSLHLAGAASAGDKQYLKQLQDLSKGYPIYFYPNIEINSLTRLYGESSIYWHAAGFEETDPTKMEHFGISTVESMAAGCIPVIIKKGGQIEIAEDKINGFFWEDKDQLGKITVKLIEDKSLREKISSEAVKRAKKFSKEEFANNLIDLISHLN